MPSRPKAQLLVHSERTVLQRWNLVREYDVESRCDGRRHLREVVHRPDVVVILPFSSGRRTATLIAQHRLAAHLSTWDGPLIEAASGRVDPGETTEEAARRELHEETGLLVSDLIPLGSYFLHPALSTERAHLYTCDIDHLLLRRDCPDTQDMIGPARLLDLPLFRLVQRGSGLIVDAKTALAVQRLMIDFPTLFNDGVAG